MLIIVNSGKITKQTVNVQIPFILYHLVNLIIYYSFLHREIVPPRETVAIAIVGRGGWGNLPYTVANENQMKA